MSKNTLVAAIVIGLAFAANQQIGGQANTIVANAINENGQVIASFVGYTPESIEINTLKLVGGSTLYTDRNKLLVGFKQFIDEKMPKATLLVGEHQYALALLLNQMVTGSVITRDEQLRNYQIVDLTGKITAMTGKQQVIADYAKAHGIPMKGNKDLIEKVDVDGAVYAYITSEQRKSGQHVSGRTATA